MFMWGLMKMYTDMMKMDRAYAFTYTEVECQLAARYFVL